MAPKVVAHPESISIETMTNALIIIGSLHGSTRSGVSSLYRLDQKLASLSFLFGLLLFVFLTHRVYTPRCNQRYDEERAGGHVHVQASA